MIRPEEIRRAVRYGGESVVFSQDEIRRLKRLEGDDGKTGDMGLTLIGFKPKERLKRHFNTKNTQFIYPDESAIRGSTTCFRALRDSCVTPSLL
jgi:ATP-dependent DNA helicase 2 subunit 1